MKCPSCGAENDYRAVACAGCGASITVTPLAPAPFPVRPGMPLAYTPRTSSLDSLIPSKNGMALAAYYLGVFAAIPCVGAFLAWPALYCGVKGLKFYRENPEARGKTHAWFGIVAGVLFGVLWTGAIIWAIVAIAGSGHGS